MPWKIPISLLYLSIFFLVISFSITTDQLAVAWTPHFVYTRCFDAVGNYTPTNTYQSNLNSLLSTLVNFNNSPFPYYASNIVGVSPDDVHGLYYCRGGLQSQDCRSCVQVAAAKAVLDCPVEMEVIIWYEECTLRYAPRIIPSPQEEDVWIAEQAPTGHVSVSPDFYGRVFDSLIKEAAYDNGSPLRYFATGKSMVTSSLSLHILVQCTPQISEDECETCLQTSVGDIPSCCGWGKDWVAVFKPSCFLKYWFTTAVGTSRRTSSTDLPLPYGNNIWHYLKQFATWMAGALAFLLTFYILRPIRHKLRRHLNFFSSGTRSSGSSSHNNKKDPKEGQSETKDHQGPCAVCKGITECPAHKQTSCVICKVTDEIRIHKQVPAAIVCPPMPPHPAVMWPCRMPNQGGNCRCTNHV